MRAAAALLLCGAAASASSIVDFSVGTCTGNNCDSIEFAGRLLGAGPQAGPWTVEVFAGGSNECLRLQVLSQGAPGAPVDLEMVAVSPNGLVYRNDNGQQAGCVTCPLVKLLSTVRGSYSVAISERTGGAFAAKFRFAYGRYNSANPNCANPIVPFAPK